MWFQLYDILEKEKRWNQWKDQWLPGVGGLGKNEWRKHRGFLGQWKNSARYHNDKYMSLYFVPTDRL